MQLVIEGQGDLWKYRMVFSGEFLAAGVRIAAQFMMWYKPEAIPKKCQLYVCVALVFVRYPWRSPGSGDSQVRSLLCIPDLEGTAQRWWKPNQRYGIQMLSLFSLFVCLPCLSFSLPSPPPPSPPPHTHTHTHTHTPPWYNRTGWLGVKHQLTPPPPPPPSWGKHGLLFGFSCGKY